MRRVGVCFEEQTANADRHAGPREFGQLLATPTRSQRIRFSPLQAMGYVEHQWQATAGNAHFAEAQHVHDEIVVAELRATLAQQDARVGEQAA